MIISSATQVLMHWKAMLLLIMILLIKVLPQYRFQYFIAILFKVCCPDTGTFQAIYSVDLS